MLMEDVLEGMCKCCTLTGPCDIVSPIRKEHTMQRAGMVTFECFCHASSQYKITRWRCSAVQSGGTCPFRDGQGVGYRLKDGMSIPTCYQLAAKGTQLRLVICHTGAQALSIVHA